MIFFDNPDKDGASGQENGDSEDVFEESIDDLFDDPDEDVVADNTGLDLLNQFEESEKVVLKGYFSARGGGGVGWDKTPDSSDLTDGFGRGSGCRVNRKSLV